MREYDPLVYPLSVVMAKSEKELNTEYESPEGKDIEPVSGNATTYRINEKNGGPATIGIVFRKKPGVGTIAHEAFHAAHFIMEYIGNDFVYEGTNESWAYLIGWIALCAEDFVENEFTEETENDNRDGDQ